MTDEERHMLEIAQLEQEIRQVRARNERLEQENRELQEMLYQQKFFTERALNAIDGGKR